MPRNAFALLSAIAMLLLLSGSAMFLARILSNSHRSGQNAYLLAQVYQVANSGLEWGIYHAMQATPFCGYTDKEFTLEDNFEVQLSCATENYPDEGIDVMNIKAVASFGALGEPDYVTRRLSVSVTLPP
jgi:hypothetical protein